MACERLEAIQDYLDGQLRGRLAEAMRAHLRECPDCARHAAAMSQLGDGVRTLPRQDPGPRLTARVLQAVQALPAPPVRPQAFFRLSRWELLGLAALYCAGALLLVPAARWLGHLPQPDWWLTLAQGVHRLGTMLQAAQTALARAAEMPWLAGLPAYAAPSAAALAGAVLILVSRPPTPAGQAKRPASPR